MGRESSKFSVCVCVCVCVCERELVCVCGGDWGNSMILILPVKIFDKIYACNLVCRLELEFPCLFCRKLKQKIDFCLFFVQNVRVALTL